MINIIYILPTYIHIILINTFSEHFYDKIVLTVRYIIWWYMINSTICTNLLETYNINVDIAISKYLGTSKKY